MLALFIYPRLVALSYSALTGSKVIMPLHWEFEFLIRQLWLYLIYIKHYKEVQSSKFEASTRQHVASSRGPRYLKCLGPRTWLFRPSFRGFSSLRVRTKLMEEINRNSPRKQREKKSPLLTGEGEGFHRLPNAQILPTHFLPRFLSGRLLFYPGNSRSGSRCYDPR